MQSFGNSDWSYLLCVIHGDGHISKRSISVSVSYREQAYADLICNLWTSLGFEPKVYRPRTAMRIDVHSKRLATLLYETKSDGIWTIPDEVDIGSYLAGVIDTDGHVTKAPQRAVIITLKRSGNLRRLSSRLEASGLRCLPVKDRVTSYNGSPYLIEDIRRSGMDQIEWIGSNAPLRHPRKRARLDEMLQEVVAIRSHVPLWRQVADWLAVEPRDIDEIGDRFGLTKRQVDSVMDNVRANRRVESLPPPRVLTKYRVVA